MGKISRFITWITRAEGVIAFGDYMWALLRNVIGLSGATMMGWLVSRLGWFWETFSWAGVFGIGIITWFIVVSGLYLTTARAMRKSAGTTPPGQPASDPDAPAPIAQGGDTFAATGTVRNPPPLDPKGLYVGSMNLSFGNLAERRVIEISIRAFNGTQTSIFVQRVEGSLRVSETHGGGAKSIGNLRPPWLVEGDGKPKIERIEHGEEFTILIEQRVPPEIAEKIEQLGGAYRLHLDCDELNIIMSSHFEGQTCRLPVWDGMTISRQPDAIATGRIVSLKVPSVTIGVGLGA